MSRLMMRFGHHPSCNNIVIDVWIPLPEPIVESVEATAERLGLLPCPICKQPLHFDGFSLHADDSDEVPESNERIG